MAVWPVTLQQVMDSSSFRFIQGDTLVRTEMDTGPVKVRRRFTKGIDILQGTILLDYSQFSTLQYFYDVTVNGGANYFDATHPLTGSTVQVRFIRPYDIKSVGGRTFQVTLEWEIQP